MQSSADEFDEIRILDEHSAVLESKKWRIFSKSGELPVEVRDERKAEQYEYDLRIAVSENLDDNVNRLFSYFRTEVKFPFPAIVHGTFELDDTRNHLVKSQTNTFLLKELASLMIDTAKKITRSEEEVNWDAMRLLAKRGEFDDKNLDVLITQLENEVIPVVMEAGKLESEAIKLLRIQGISFDKLEDMIRPKDAYQELLPPRACSSLNP